MSASKPPFSVVVEGLPGAGKTSCCEYLAKHAGFVLLPEYVLDRVLLNSWRSTHSKNTTTIHLANWAAKAQLIADPMQSYLLDRNHLTALAYHHALTQVTGTDSISAVKSWYETLLTRGELVEPTCYLIFELPSHLSLSRRKLTDDQRYVWSNRRALDLWANYYTSLPSQPPWAFRDDPCPQIIKIDATAPANVVRQHAANALADVFPGTCPPLLAPPNHGCDHA